MNYNSLRQLQNGKIISRIPVFNNTNLTFNAPSTIESNSSQTHSDQGELAATQQDVESKFNGPTDELTERKSMLSTLVG